MTEVSRLERIGVALFEKLDPAPVVAMTAPMAAAEYSLSQAVGQCELHRSPGDGYYA